MYSITDSVLQEGNSSIFKIFHKQARNSDSLRIKGNEIFLTDYFQIRILYGTYYHCFQINISFRDFLHQYSILIS